MRRRNIILDLDNTLISSVDQQERKLIPPSILRKKMKALQWKNMGREYKVFERPYLQEFLSWLFQHFNVSVWTAASKLYASFIIEEFILTSSNRKLDYILFSHHCEQSKHKHNKQKSLDMLSKVFPTNYDPLRTYIIDDNKEVYKSQPSRCIRIKEFDVRNVDAEYDTELLRIKALLSQLL